MAVSYVDSDINSSATPSSSFPSVSVLGSDTAALALIGIGFFDPSDTLNATARIGGSATGVVQIGSTFSVSGGAFRMQLFYKIAPGTGTLSIDATTGSNVENRFVTGAVYSGVNQSSPVGTLATGSQNDAAPTILPGGGDANGILVGFFQTFASAMTISTGTQREQLFDGAASKTGAWADRTSGAIAFTQSAAVWGAIGVAVFPEPVSKIYYHKTHRPRQFAPGIAR